MRSTTGRLPLSILIHIEFYEPLYNRFRTIMSYPARPAFWKACHVLIHEKRAALSPYDFDTYASVREGSFFTQDRKNKKEKGFLNCFSLQALWNTLARTFPDLCKNQIRRSVFTDDD